MTVPSNYLVVGCEDAAHESTDWTEIVDRGGLIHVSDTIYMLFVSIEMELRRHLAPANPDLELISKSKDVLENEDVQFYWATVSFDWEEREAEALLHMIVEHYITVRGFSFTSGVMEKYKKENKKTVQKSKGLRKNLLSSSGSTDDKE